MIKIEVSSTEVRNVSGTSQRNGKSFSFYKQDAWAHLPGEPYPTRIELTVDKPEEAFPVGSYKLLPESLFVNQYSSLSLAGKLRLQPIAASTQAKSA